MCSKVSLSLVLAHLWEDRGRQDCWTHTSRLALRWTWCGPSQLRTEGSPEFQTFLGTLYQKWRKKTKQICLIINQTSNSHFTQGFPNQGWSRLHLPRTKQQRESITWSLTWGSRCSAWTKWRGQEIWGLALWFQFSLGKKKKWNDDSLLQMQTRAGRDSWLMFWGQISDSQIWLHSRIPWGTSKNIQMPGHYSRPSGSKSPEVWSKNMYFSKLLPAGSELTSLP